MSELYTKVVDDDGKETFVVSEPVAQDDETFFADKRYKDVAERDIKRRTKHTDLVSAIEKQGFIVDDKGNVVKGTAEVVAPVVPVTQQTAPVPVPEPIDWDAKYLEFQQRQATETATAETQASEKRLQMTTLMTQHQLKGDDVMNILLTSDDPTLTAGVLGKLGLKFEDSEGGQGSESDTADVLDTLFAGVKKRMGLPDTE